MLATAAVLAVMLARGHLEEIGQPIYEFVSDLPPILTEWVPDIVFAILPVQGNERVILGGLVVVALIGLATLVGSQLWNRWSMRDTEREPGGRAGKPSGPQVAFYVWSLFRLLVLGGVALFGPGPIASQVLGIADKSDEIVQAWASAYIWTLIVGVVAFIWATSPDRVSVSDAKFRVIGGVSLALSLEPARDHRPGRDAHPHFASVRDRGRPRRGSADHAHLAVPPVGGRARATLVEDQEERPQAHHVASVIDYLGFIGLLLALLAIGLAVVGYLGVKVDNVNRLWFAAGALAPVAAALGLLLAVNEHGVPEPRTRPVQWPTAHFRAAGAGAAAMRMTERGSSTTMRSWVR